MDINCIISYNPMKAQRYKKPDSVKELERISFIRKREKHPTIPIELLCRDNFRDDTANGLTKCITTFIQIKGGQAERISTTGRCIDRTVTYTDVVGITRTMGSVEWIPGTVTRGSADISATIKGRSVKIEVKIGADRQRREQIQYQKDIEAAGGIYYIARNFTTFVEWYNTTFGL